LGDVTFFSKYPCQGDDSAIRLGDECRILSARGAASRESIPPIVRHRRLDRVRDRERVRRVRQRAKTKTFELFALVSSDAADHECHRHMLVPIYPLRNL
jgi:hypothetical protein